MFVWMIVPMLLGLAESLDLDFRCPKFLEEFFQFRGSSLKCAFVYEDRELPGLLSVTPLAAHLDASLQLVCFCERKEPAHPPDKCP
jgi:hypothetical protein